MNYASLQKIKSRLLGIIDSVLVQYGHSPASQYGLDESRLEDFVYLVKDMIILPQKIIEPVNRPKNKSAAEKKAKKIIAPKPSISNAVNNGQSQLSKNTDLPQNQLPTLRSDFAEDKLVEIVSGSKLNVYQLKTENKKQAKSFKQLIHTSAYQFPNDTLKRYSSITQVSYNKFVVAGGCFYSNPTAKSQNIYIFQTDSGSFTKVGELVEPLSSHACVYVAPKVYFIGGKKNEGIITRMCSYFHVHQKQTVEIAALNYSAASLCATNWKNTHIYKIGGLGQCFGQWSISPYIERYSIEQNVWEVINPYINENILTNFTQFQLYAHSICYVSEKDEIVILGGFGFDKKGTNFGCVMKVKDKIEQKVQEQDEDEQMSGLRSSQVEDNHEITEFGQVEGLEAGGFWTSAIIKIGEPLKKARIGSSSLIMLQTTTNPQIETKIISVLSN